MAKKKEALAVSFAKKVRKNIAIAISAAFAFIIALVWRDAIQEAVNKIVVEHLPAAGYILTLITAIIITVICVIGIIIFSRWSEKK